MTTLSTNNQASKPTRKQRYVSAPFPTTSLSPSNSNHASLKATASAASSATATTASSNTSLSSSSVSSASSPPEHSAAFPKTFSYSGYLDMRFKTTKPWKRRFFVVNNNFLLCAATPHASKLSGVYPLEGSTIKKPKKKKKKKNKNIPSSSPTTTPTTPKTPGPSDMTFQIFIRKHCLFFRAASPSQCNQWKEHIVRASKLKIKDIYRFLYTLGTSESQMTKVVAAKHRTTNEDCAIKIVDKRNCSSRMLKTEIQILKKLDNPYIVQLYDIFETKKYLYIVMEKCLGGELFDQIAELDGEHYTEQDCCHVLHQIARAVKYMHQQGIVHRDLKPENILCVHPNSIKRIKLADFGISKMVKKQSKNGKGRNISNNKPQLMHTMVGTLSYTAPEILRGKGYDHTVDYWSIGIIMFILLCGYPPFWGENDHDISRSILKDDVIFDDDDWEHVAPDTKELVAGLLNKNPSMRLTTNHVLKLAFKVSSKNVAFKKSRMKFKETLIKRKLRGTSMSAFEKNSHLMNKITYRYKNNIKSHHTINGTGSDDNTNSLNSNQKILNKYNRQTVKAWRGRKGSKTTEELLELQLPINKRDSLMLHFETDDDVKKRLKKQQQISNKNMDMNTLNENDDDDDDNDNVVTVNNPATVVAAVVNDNNINTPIVQVNVNNNQQNTDNVDNNTTQNALSLLSK